MFVQRNFYISNFEQHLFIFLFQMLPISVFSLSILSSFCVIFADTEGDPYTDYVNHAKALADCKVHCSDKTVQCIQMDPHSYTFKLQCGVTYGQCLNQCQAAAFLPLVTSTQKSTSKGATIITQTTTPKATNAPAIPTTMPSNTTHSAQIIHWVTLKK